MLSSSASNREKIYSAGGEVSFGKVYNCCTVMSPFHSIRSPDNCSSSVSTVRVLLSSYTAVKAIRKSPGSKNNRNKICKKGRTLYVLGEVAGPDTREYFVFSEDTWVFRREWAELKELVVFTGNAVVEMDVIKTGEVKNKWEMPRRSRRKTTRINAFQVQFTNDPMSAVWFTPYGLQHMTELVNTLQSQHCMQTEMSAGRSDEKGDAKIPRWTAPCENMYPVPSLGLVPEEEPRNTKLSMIEESHFVVSSGDTNSYSDGDKKDSETEQLGNNTYSYNAINESNQTEDRRENKSKSICNKERKELRERKGYTEQSQQPQPQQTNKTSQMLCDDFACDNVFEPLLLEPQDDYEDFWAFPYV